MKIRTITVGSRIDKPQEIIPLIAQAKQAQDFFRGKGYEVQTIRVTVNSQNQEAIIDEIGNICRSEKFDILSIGQIKASLIKKIPEILVRNKSLYCSVNMREQNGIRHTAEIIVELAKLNAVDNLRFAGTINIPPKTPFFPAAYHEEEKPCFSIGLQTVREIFGTVDGTKNLDDTSISLLAKLNGVYKEIENLAIKLSQELGIEYGGLDTSAAPMGEESIGYAIEKISKVKFGEQGTKDACRFITGVLKSITVKRVGYCGLMLPPLEDSGLGQRNNEGLYTISDLLEYSSVCGTGLDTVPIPGDVTVTQLMNILKKVADLSQKLHKPLSARFFPIPGKAAGEMTEFDSPYLYNTKVMEIK